MALLGPLRLAVLSLFFRSRGGVLTRGDSFLLAVIGTLGIITFVFEGFGLFALMTVAFGSLPNGFTLGTLMGLPHPTGPFASRITASVVVALVLARILINPILSYALQWLGERVAYRMRMRVLTLATALPAINAGAIPSGELSSIINEEIARCGRALVSLISSLQLMGGVLFSTVFLVARDPKVNLAAIAAALPGMAIYGFIASRSSKDTRSAVAARVNAGGRMTEGLRALAGIQAAGGGRTLMRVLSDATAELRRRETKIFVNQTTLQYAMALVPIMAGTGAFAYVWYVLGATTPQAIAAVLMPTAVVGSRIAGASSGVVMNAYSTSVYASSFGPVSDLLLRLTRLSRRRAADAGPSQLSASDRLKAVELQHCSFQLPNGVWLFRDLSVTATANRPILLRGASGTGKSTLASVVAGANDPTEGKVVYILEDGREVPPQEGYLNYLSQDPAVISGTVRQNLLLGSSDETNDTLLIEALKQVRLWDEFEPKGGLAAEIFEGGRNLSGGQIRRLGLARLLTREKGLWIFDEATASLDSTSAAIVEGFIHDLSLTRVVLVIAHDVDFRIVGTEIQLFHNSSAKLFRAA